MKRPPIIVVMGHVDHGKTTLLDYIRKTSVASREAGGITQSLGAYEIAHNGEKITFLDTPGHEAFSKMRARGAQVADIAILVVAAEEGIKPQTKDALKYILQEKIPYIVAVNKIDKPGANVEKIKQDLAQNEVFLEGYGGSISWQAVSAKTGEGVNELLDLVVLAADLQNLEYDPASPTIGIVVSGHRDSKKGIVVGGILKNGKLEAGQELFTQSTKGRVRFLEDFQGKTVKTLTPSAPVIIVGFETLPAVGETFSTKKELLPEIAKAEKKISEDAEGAPEKVRLVLKANEGGSLEALEHVMERVAETYPLAILEKNVGNITENDVKLAVNTGSIIIGFKVKEDKAAGNLIRTQNVPIISSSIIYELEKNLAEYLEKGVKKEKRSIEILAVFSAPKGKRQVVGGKILLGPIKNQERFEVEVNGEITGTGKIMNLQSQKADALEVETGKEAGLLVEADVEIKAGNKLLFG